MLALGSTHALFLQPDLEKIPVKRLLENLEKQVAAEPEDAAKQHHLARAHAMAYAKGLAAKDAVELEGESKELWFGHQPSFVPYHAYQRTGSGSKEIAHAHLQKAIAAYAKALALDPDKPTIRLGYGWCLEQAGKKDEAIAAYRTAMEAFWKDDQKLDGVFGPVASKETASYLIPLLDAKKDAKEIAELKRRVAQIERLPRAITPIAVALDPTTTLAEILDDKAAVRFDADATGRQATWRWITPKAAWLVHDLAGNGEIDSAIQLFGNRSFNLFLEDGYAALRLLDTNADGFLTGIETEHLALWQDADGDGKSAPQEVRSLEAWGITALVTGACSHASGILHAPDGARFRDGRSAATYDVILKEVN